MLGVVCCWAVGGMLLGLLMCQRADLLQMMKELKIPIGTGQNKMTRKEQYVGAIRKSGWSQQSISDDGDDLDDVDDQDDEVG
eukprot:COSAG02_NODE_1650_length_11487_cov_13.602895_4_plen_82_part_00